VENWCQLVYSMSSKEHILYTVRHSGSLKGRHSWRYKSKVSWLPEDAAILHVLDEIALSK